jgi:hypothetical protein
MAKITKRRGYDPIKAARNSRVFRPVQGHLKNHGKPVLTVILPLFSPRLAC